MQITETWSIDCERVTAFFSGQDGVRANGESRFSYGTCEILVTPLPPRGVGRFQFPQTQVSFTGPEPDREEIHRRFVLQFISAGG